MVGFLITDPFELAKKLIEVEARVKAIEDKLNMVSRVERKWGESPTQAQLVIKAGA